MSTYSFIRFCKSIISEMEWTSEIYLRFIDDYRNASVLWDIRNPNYKNNRKKRNVVLGLAQKYGVDESALKKKIKNLRSAFHREHHRLTNKKGGSIDEARRWFAYDALKFILDVTGPFDAIKEDTSPFAMDETVHHGDTEEDQDYSGHNLVDLPPHLPERSSPDHNALNPILINKEEDEYDLFGRSMAMQLRKMPELTALELMQKMQLMVLNSKKQLTKEKVKTKPKIAKLAAQASSASNMSTKKVRTPSPDLSSNQSTPSPCYKYEVMSPSENSSRICEETGRDFTYVTTVEHTESFPENSKNIGDSLSVKIQREGKRKLSNSIDPLEMKQSKLCGSRFMNS